MKITIEPTDPQTLPDFEGRQHKVAIEIDGDPGCLDDVLNLVGYALTGFGFHQKNVEEAFNNETSD